MGRITVAQIAEKTGQNTGTLFTILKEQGINATPQTTIKEIAGRLGISAQEAYRLLAGK